MTLAPAVDFEGSDRRHWLLAALMAHAPDEILAEAFAVPAWHDDAACRGMGPDLFFPGRGEPTEPARAICEGCPVRQACADYAADQDEPLHGIWGGLTARARRRGIRRAHPLTDDERARAGLTPTRPVVSATGRERLSTVERRRRVAELRAEGHTVRLIAAEVGAAKSVIGRDLKILARSGAKRAPAPPDRLT